MYCLHEDKDNIKFFFETIKSIIGQLTPHIFMSDMADYYYEAWNEVFGPAQHRVKVYLKLTVIYSNYFHSKLI